MFCLYTSSKLSHPQFEFSMKVKMRGSNQGCLLKYFLLYLNPLCTIILLNMYWTHLKTLCTRKRKICFDTVTHRHFWYVLQNCRQNGWTVMYMTSFKSKYLSTVNDEQQRVFKNSNEDPDFSIFFSTYVCAYVQAWTS